MPRRTTGGPAANIAERPLVITLQCTIIARPEGPPAIAPSTAASTGTLRIASIEVTKFVPPFGR